MEQTYPLQWPPNVPRNRYPVDSKFEQTQAKAIQFLDWELQRLGASNAVMTSDLGPRKADGTLYARARVATGDEGIAVYFDRKNVRHCIACDKYGRCWENIYAIAKTIEALRGIERWGSGGMMDAAISGFAALPAPTVAENWWDVLGVSRETLVQEVSRSYRNLAKVAHPDAGGSDEAMARLNVAYDSFRAERKVEK